MSEADDRLVQKAQQGSPEAIASIYDSNYSAVYRYIYFRLGDQDCAEDLASEVFVRMVEQIKYYQVRGKPIIAWLYTIAHNLVVDYFHKQSRVNTMLQKQGSDEIDKEHPALVAERNQEEEFIKKVIANLTEKQRQFIMLRFFEGYELAEIANLMGQNERAIRSLQHRALAALNKSIKNQGLYGW